jgi:hypothetical protein
VIQNEPKKSQLDKIYKKYYADFARSNELVWSKLKLKHRLIFYPSQSLILEKFIQVEDNI